VTRQITIRRLLAISMIVGLVLAPFSRPVMAGAASDASMAAASDMSMADDMSANDMSMHDMSAHAMMAEMADGMPCCPTKAPMPVDCDKCVFMASCMVTCFTTPSAAVLYSFAVSGQMLRPKNDFRPDSLGRPPPEHPPRRLV
jgi:hypothetical protein